ncbi:hypothetical protein Tco_1497892 [Tanacetum coccineum]
MEGNRGLRYGLRAENEWKRKVVNGGAHEEEKCEKEDVKTVEVDDKEINMELFDKCVIGEVKSLFYLTKIVNLCTQVKVVEQALYSSREINMVKVQIHTFNNGLIKEALYVKVKGRKFKVDVIEEVRDIVEFEIEVAFNNNSESNEDDCEEETDSEDDESDEDDDDDVGGGGWPEDDGGRKRDEDEESRCSDMSRVCETPEEEVIKEHKVAAPR